MDFGEAVPCSGKVASFSPDSKYLALVHGPVVIVREAHNFSTVVRRFSAEDAVDQLEWSSDSSLLLCAMTKRGLAQVFSVHDVDFRCRIDESVSLGLSHVLWSPDSRHVLTVSDFSVRITVWSLLDGSSLVLSSPKSMSANRKGICFSPDGKFVALLSRKDCRDSIAILTSTSWEFVSGFDISSSVRDAVDLSWSPDQATIAVWDTPIDYSVALYRPDGVLLSKYKAYEDGLGVRCTVWNPSGQLLAVGSYDGVVRVLNNLSWRPVCQFAHTVDDALLTGRCFASVVVFREQRGLDGLAPQYDAAVFKRGSAHVDKDELQGQREAATNAQLFSFLSKHVRAVPASQDPANPKQGISRALWSADSRFLACKSDMYPTIIWIWDVPRLQLSAMLLQQDPVRSFAWHSAQPLLAACCGNQNIYLWTPSGASCATAPTQTGIQKVVWNGPLDALAVFEETRVNICWLNLKDMPVGE